MERFRRFLQGIYKDYKHLLLLLYFPIYLTWFIFLEKTVTRHFHVIHMNVDDMIPFCEIFIIPYLLWFAYITVVILYMGWKDKREFIKLCKFLFAGMTLFVVISTIYPNGHFLRPTYFERDNVFTHLCGLLYQTDTATNLFPSIHVYNSIGVHLAIISSKQTRKNKIVTNLSFLLMASIILSTVFLKQHSVFDVLTAFLTAMIFYPFAYKHNFEYQLVRIRKRIPQL